MDNDQGLTYLKNETIKQIYDICLKDVTTSNGLTPDALSCIVAIALRTYPFSNPQLSRKTSPKTWD